MRQPGIARVPLLDLKAQYAEIRDEIDVAIRRVVESQYFVLGPDVEALEAELAEYCGVRHAVGCASGSDALLLALMALGVEPGDEILCPTYSFFSTAGTIARLGAVPVFVDIEPDSFNVSADTLREAAGRCTRLRAVLPVHLYGRMAPMDDILAFARDRDVPVIEDAAQAIGARDAAGRSAGSIADLGCFSFFPSKNLGGYGDGGLVTTDDDALADWLRKMRVHGAERKYYHEHVGLNSRLDSLQAAVLRVKLRHLDAWHEGRQHNAAAYDELFAKAGGRPGHGGFEGQKLALHTPRPAPEPERHIYNQYVIRVPADLRDALRAHLAEHEIGSEIYYPLPLHLQECFAVLGMKRGDLPVSERAAAETIALPIYAELTPAQIETVVARVSEFLER